jgi:hypothetical protein
MRGGNDSFWFAEPRTHAAAKGAERAAAGQQSLGGQAKNMPRSIGGLNPKICRCIRAGLTSGALSRRFPLCSAG